MLNARNEENNTVFYSYLACFVNTFSLEYLHIHVIYQVNQAEYGIHILVLAPQEHVNIYSTRRFATLRGRWCALRSGFSLLGYEQALVCLYIK